MSDRLALLRAILANPAENTPRLVYADWLEEHGTTPADTARVEFIRLWYRLKPGLRTTTKALAAWLWAKWPQLWPSAVSARVLRAQGRVLTVNFGGLSTVKVYFDRGFAERIQFGSGKAYSRAWRDLATDEPLAVLEPEGYPKSEGVHPNRFSVVRRADWGPDVFNRLAGFYSQPSPDEKRYHAASGMSHFPARAAIGDAMTTIAREANGLLPQTQGAG
jgi:uncharacterized protein (TIGR02996 family)